MNLQSQNHNNISQLFKDNITYNNMKVVCCLVVDLTKHMQGMCTGNTAERF